MSSAQPKVLRLCQVLAGFYIVWSAWAFLLVQHPELNQGGVLRAAVRLLVWTAPVFLYTRMFESSVLENLGLRCGVIKGVAIGLVGFVVVLLLTVAQRRFVIQLTLPRDAATWLNPIFTAPLAEELLFRGLVFRILRGHFGVLAGFLASALLFSLAHLPYWWISGDKTGVALLVGLTSMFAYGLFFAGLYQWSGSLWSPLICHWLNNFLMVSFD
ncbi:MAG: CPBP family intramembrane glutamic endopeptidase [Verrucomicrobiota bacterium]